MEGVRAMTTRVQCALVVASLLGVLAVVPATAASGAPSPIVVIVLENRDYATMIKRPYLASFADGGRLFTHYFAITHPSLPNYMAMTNGDTGTCPTDSCAVKSDADPNIFSQVGDPNWAVYAESMPSKCYLTDADPYEAHHNPPLYYSNLFPGSCPMHDKPLPSTGTPVLAPLTVVIPNNCHNFHGDSACPPRVVKASDQWLSTHVPGYLDAGATVLITFDEGTHTGTNQVYTAVEGPGIAAGQTDRTSYDHYSLLAGLEDSFGVSRLGSARNATPLPLS